jgi:hypothetical protein
MANIISVKITLQQWTGSSWQDVTSYTFTNTYTDYVWGLRNVSVEKGKYYRVLGNHYAHDNFLVDEISSTTPAIYVE